MSEWGGSWGDVRSAGGLEKGWHELNFAGYDWRDKENGVWLLLKFPGANMSLNFFPGTDHAGRAKADEISRGKLKNFFEAAGCDENTMPDLDPEGIKKALDAFEVSGVLVGCYVKEDDRGYMNTDRFRKAK